MILRSDDTAPRAEPLAFCVLWSTGPDTARDGLFRVQAMRRDGPEAPWTRFDSFCRPFEAGRGAPDGSGESGADARATRRMGREFGVRGDRLEGAPSAAAVWAELRAFLSGAHLIVPDREEHASWAWRYGASSDGEAGSDPTEPDAPTTIGLAELAGLLFPGRLAADRRVLCARLLPAHPDLPRAVGPVELQAAVGILVGRFLEQPEPVLALAGHAFGAALERLDREAGLRTPAAARLARALELVERPSLWSGGHASLFPVHGALGDGRLSAALDAFPSLEDALDEARPPWARPEPVLEPPTVPPDVAEEDVEREPGADSAARIPFHSDDLRTLDEIFEVHLPAHFAGPGGEPAPYRAGQHAVAREVARSLGAGELLLVHAPTGTGKTLAYLLPAMLWSARHGVRVGVATYTRALQEQAMDREVPLARRLLERAGRAETARVALLKGRRNSLCWRSFRLLLPDEADRAETLLAWTAVALFALTDPDGDLDRLPRCPFLGLVEARDWQRAVDAVVRVSRSDTACCSRRADRDTCAGDCSRRRAERSHVVLTNLSFALSRPEFFRHIVFDECEHLHDVAHSSWSHVIGVGELRDLLRRFVGEDSGGALEKVLRAALEGSEVHASAAACARACRSALSSLARLEASLDDFKAWRDEGLARREPRDAHSLFREYAALDRADELLEAHVNLVSALSDLSAESSALLEHLDELPSRSVARLRRTLELLRGDLEERAAGVEAWIPRADRRPSFRPETYYDLEADGRGTDVLSARVLLPHEVLGRHYYGDLKTGVFLSATTCMAAGFEPAAGYLGLERAAHPAEDELRPPSVVRTFRAPEVFDYGRVLVAVPRDAPGYARDKGGFLEYVARFVACLGERTRGRMLVLFTSIDDCRRTGRRVAGFFRERQIAFWYQGMAGAGKEELSDRFRSRVDSVLMGVDTFWYGADFPGETLEYLVIVKLPYGVPDAYHHAQCAVMGSPEQRKRIYMPRALAKFRQGFGRLMRKETDRGCVFLLDGRVLEPRHRGFLRELPLADPLAARKGEEAATEGARLVRGDTDHCLREALAHMEMLADVRLRGLEQPFARTTLDAREDDWLERVDPVDLGAGDVPF